VEKALFLQKEPYIYRTLSWQEDIHEMPIYPPVFPISYIQGSSAERALFWRGKP
jgi:hypothetical protein